METIYIGKTIDMKSITIVLPAYNEEKNIEKAVQASVDVLKELVSEYEVIVVDDGSKDRTGKLADDLADKNNNIKVIHHPENRGYGPSLKTGFSNARGELIFTAPADNQQDISELRLFLPMIENADIVAGYRLRRYDPFCRRLNAKLWNVLVSSLFKISVRDIDWVKLYRKKVLNDIEIEADSAFMDTEILARAARKGFIIKEVGVHHYPRKYGKQSGNDITVIFKAFKDLFGLYRRLKCK